MHTFVSRVQVFLLCCLGLFLVIFNLDSGTTNSIDLAHAYALAFRISEHWHLVPGDPTLGEMNFYPAGSHVIAAILGMLLDSTLMGLQATALAAVALIWGALVCILNTLRVRIALASSVLLAGMLWANHAFLGLDLHGSEIVGNFFYPQLVAQGLALGAIAVAMHLDATRTPLHATLFLVAAIYGIASVHLLPALELLGMLCGMALLHVVTMARPWRQRGWAALGALLAGAAGLAAVLLNPSFAAMRKISEINGNLTLVLFPGKPALVLLCLAVLGTALLLLWMWNSDRAGLRALRFLAPYGASIALLCLLQLILLQFHFGSEYAVKKYAFGLSSFLFLSVAILLGWLLERLMGQRQVPRPFAGVATTLVALAVLATAFTYCARWVKLNDNSDAVAIERQLLAVKRSTLLPVPDGKVDVALDLKNQPWTMNYLFSIALAHTPRELAMRRVLEANELGDLGQYHTILSSRGFSRYAFAGCERPGSGPILMLDGACVAKAVAEGRLCKRVVDFSERGNIMPSLLSGFSWPQPDRRWTDGPKSTFSCVLGERFTAATISLSPFLHASHPRQRVAFSVNGGAPVRVEFEGKGAPRQLTLTLPDAAPGATLVFTLETPDAKSPQELGINSDWRRLGVGVTTLRFE